MAEKTYTTAEAAQESGIGRDTLQRWMRNGWFAAPEISQLGPFDVRIWQAGDVSRLKEYARKYRGSHRKGSKRGMQ